MRGEFGGLGRCDFLKVKNQEGAGAAVDEFFVREDEGGGIGGQDDLRTAIVVARSPSAEEVSLSEGREFGEGGADRGELGLGFVEPVFFRIVAIVSAVTATGPVGLDEGSVVRKLFEEDF